MNVDELPLRDELRGKSPYGAPQLDVPVRLNTNENPHPPSAALVADISARIAAAAKDLNRYPDRDALALRAALAAYLGHRLTAAQVWAANGSNEILQQLLQAFGGPGRTALGFEPSYSMHPLISEATGTAYVSEPRGPGFALTAELALSAIEMHRPDFIFVCSPNNPTATAIHPSVIDVIYAAAQSQRPAMVVVDEAYAEFSHHPSHVGLLAGRPRLVVTRTMSKAFAFAGARVGYLAADRSVVDALQLVRLPYHLSALTQTAALTAIEHADELLSSVADVKAQRDRIVQELRAAGFDVIDSDANFVLFGEFHDQSAVWRQLLDHGVLVRDVGLSGWLRVTAGTEAETSAFLAAMTEVKP